MVFLVNAFNNACSAVGNFIDTNAEKWFTKPFFEPKTKFSVDDDFADLCTAVRNKESLVIKDDGTWYKNHKLVVLIFKTLRIFFTIIGRDESIRTAKQVTNYLHTLNRVTREKAFPPSPDTPKFHTLSKDRIKDILEEVKGALNCHTDNEAYKRSISQRKLREGYNKKGLFDTSALINVTKRDFDSRNFPTFTALANLQRACIAAIYLPEKQATIDQESPECLEKTKIMEKLFEWQTRTFPEQDFFGGWYKKDNISTKNLVDMYLLLLYETKYGKATTLEDLKKRDLNESIYNNFKENFSKNPLLKGLLEKVTRCCQYKEFIESTLRAEGNPLLLDVFFHAVFRNASPDCVEAVDIFMQAPLIQEALHRSYLDVRVQHIFNKGLTFEEQINETTNTPIKNVKLLINHQYQSITDFEGTVSISDKTTMKVKELFRTFKEGLDRGFIKYQYLQDGGICEFDGRIYQLENFDLSETNKDRWWEDLPVIERLTRSQIMERYKGNERAPAIDFSSGHALLILRANRKNPDLNADDTHSWLDITIPLKEKIQDTATGEYVDAFNVISVGKFSKNFPITFVEKFNFVFLAHEATITLTDPNKYCSSREEVAFPFPALTEADFKKCMEKIRRDLLRCKNKQEYFEAQGANCASWVESMINEIYPEFFSLLDVEKTTKTPRLFLTPFYEIIANPFLDPFIKINFLRRWLSAIMGGAWRGVDFKNDKGVTHTVRLWNNLLWHKGFLRHPGAILEPTRKEEIWKALKDLNETRNQPLPQSTFPTPQKNLVPLTLTFSDTCKGGYGNEEPGYDNGIFVTT